MYMYYEYWVTTTKTIDYAITDLSAADGGSEVTLARNGLMPMPLDLVVEYTDGTREIHYIPLRIMRGEKENEITELKRHVEADWPWVFPEYRLTVDRSEEAILQLEIDPSQRKIGR